MFEPLKPCSIDARRNLQSNGQVESVRRALRLELWQFVFLTSVFLRFFLPHIGFEYCGSLQLQGCAICYNNIKSACSGTPCGSTYVRSYFSIEKYSGFWLMVFRFRIEVFGSDFRLSHNSKQFRRNQGKFKEFPWKSTRIPRISVEINENSRNFRRNQQEFKELPSKPTRIQ